MSIDYLLEPRFKLIADFPGNNRKVGEVIDFQDLPGWPTLEYYERYPHLFKKLEWWEDIKPEDVPTYVKTNPENARDGLVFKVFEVKEFVDGLGIIHSDEHNEYQIYSQHATPLKYFLPATCEEFDQYINNYKAKKDGQ